MHHIYSKKTMHHIDYYSKKENWPKGDRSSYSIASRINSQIAAWRKAPYYKTKLKQQGTSYK
jgi:hypothetical protein